MSVANYSYRALSRSGAVVTGETEVDSAQLLKRQLQTEGCLLLSVERSGGPFAFLQRDLFGRAGPNAKEFDLLIQQLTALLVAGLSADRALEVALAVNGSGRTADTLRGLQAALHGGSGLAEAMATAGPPFDASLVAMVRAGEEAGALPTVLTRVSEGLSRRRALNDQLRSAMIYPAALVLLSVASVIVLVTAVLPEFRPLFEMSGQDMPLMARILLGAGDLVSAWWWLGLTCIATGILLLGQGLRMRGPRLGLHRLVLRMPVLGTIIANVETARLSRTLATLLHNGVPLLRALGIARETLGNAAYAEAVAAAAAGLKHGRGLADPLQTSTLVPPLLAHMVRVGEETGKLPDMLSKVADLFEGEVKTATERLVALLVPTVTLVMGIVVAGIITTILTTMLSVNDLAG
ncbi:type II secretion system F family protein [Pelagibius sp. 7325]|uniref:type II secretion system F family protein n=1 Tax=Pelagibius sp. 7325 TaxID=3131994 RepID=UPI0030EB16F6